MKSVISSIRSFVSEQPGPLIFICMISVMAVLITYLSCGFNEISDEDYVFVSSICTIHTGYCDQCDLNKIVAEYMSDGKITRRERDRIYRTLSSCHKKSALDSLSEVH